MHRPLVYLIFIIAAFSIPSLALAESNNLPAKLEKAEAVTAETTSVIDEINPISPVHVDYSVKSSHNEATNVKEAVAGIKENVLDSAELPEEPEINLEAEGERVELTISFNQAKVEAKKSSKGEEMASHPPTANKNTSVNTFENNTEQSDQTLGTQPERNIAESVKNTENMPKVKFQQPKQESSSQLPEREKRIKINDCFWSSCNRIMGGVSNFC